jgi:hypothetical protein
MVGAVNFEARALRVTDGIPGGQPLIAFGVVGVTLWPSMWHC